MYIVLGTSIIAVSPETCILVLKAVCKKNCVLEKYLQMVLLS